ncbi:Tat pathway signal sequence [Propionibacterium australiense]|uniref:Glycoside hydrolase superfamily n=1 Tax=Propionibacterium australiense TaxID=119981 RepID=A0A383S856_9ACTN|nr:Tat pathway signal sequence [Propionibacterium australiense]RLP09652.1 Tat pathway signal sequence [Propionibacterium australiense]RLP12354.1 Tat pathway signal sequence [Propionibacterium australiense]SYZ33559.1 Glycoside hydrolase superfamily [Propionibacterium australiense]VEH89575.1 Uncharacterised protein [Propionibacterium australiense]
MDTHHSPRLSRRALLVGSGGASLALTAACSPSVPVAEASPSAAGTAQLDVTGPDGGLLDFAGLRRIQSNGAGEDAWDDQLLHPETLEVLDHAPLYEDAESSAAVDLPEGGATLSLSWPTSHGYSALLADIPGPGRHSLAELAARSLHERQQPRIDALPASPERTAAETLRQKTSTALDACGNATGPAERAARGAEALEAATGAQLMLDETCLSLAPSDALIGVTFTRPPDTNQLTRAAGIGGGRRPVAARIVVEDDSDTSEMDSWRRTISALHASGSLAMVQICDSQLMGELDQDEWNRRVSDLVQGLPEADAWEIGNELGGSWLGDDVIERTLQAARAVRANQSTTGATTVLTLYHQLGQDGAENSVLSWARSNLTSELLDLTDVLGLSVYPQWHPLGSGADRVLTTLAAAFPAQRVALTELGYGADDLDAGPWWFGDEHDTAAARTATARHLTSTALGRPECWGAPFWWYYLEDEEPGSPGGPVSETLTEAAQGTSR